MSPRALRWPWIGRRGGSSSKMLDGNTTSFDCWKIHTEKTRFPLPFKLNWIWSCIHFSFRFSEPNGFPFGSKLKGELSPQSYPIEFEGKRKYSFLSACDHKRSCYCIQQVRSIHRCRYWKSVFRWFYFIIDIDIQILFCRWFYSIYRYRYVRLFLPHNSISFIDIECRV